MVMSEFTYFMDVIGVIGVIGVILAFDSWY